jgi:hypothetical protein
VPYVDSPSPESSDNPTACLSHVASSHAPLPAVPPSSFSASLPSLDVKLDVSLQNIEANDADNMYTVLPSSQLVTDSSDDKQESLNEEFEVELPIPGTDETRTSALETPASEVSAFVDPPITPVSKSPSRDGLKFVHFGTELGISKTPICPTWPPAGQLES